MISKHFNPFNSVVAEPSVPQHTTIKETAEQDRPREKLMAKGAEALSLAELLAILIGNGTTNKTAVELTQEILNDCESSLANLSRMTLEELTSYNGIGEAKALSIIAAAEIGRRRTIESVNELTLFDSAKTTWQFMLPRIQDLSHEESWVLLLNNNSRLIRLVHISKGGLTETSVDPRVVFKHACMANATCIVLVHNHPSGRTRPSRADDELTHRVVKAGEIMNVRLIDHVIVTDSDYFSYAENGKL